MEGTIRRNVVNLHMAAPKGNEFWKMVQERRGRPAAFDSPEDLWLQAITYFKWVSENPLLETKVFGTGLKMTVPKMRAMTEKAFSLWCGISEQTFRNYKKEPESNETNAKDFFEVAKRISDIIYQQKFEGAAAEFLNANIIARDLGLADRSEVTGKDGEPLQTILPAITVNVVRPADKGEMQHEQ